MSAPTVAGDELPIRYPPFPPRPLGVSIVPFEEFKPAGYKRVVNDDGVEIEVDGMVGLPTIKVLSEQEVAKKRKDTKKRRLAGNATDANGRLIPWWEEWEEGEASRTTSIPFTRNIKYEDRVFQAADDFRVGRTWPEISLGVRIIWDQFRLYIGLISSMPIYKKVKTKRNGEVDGPNNAAEASDEDEGPKAKQTNVIVIQDYLEQTAAPGKEVEPSADDSGVEAQRLRAFVDDFEKTIKVFLSSYMRDTGLIWTERNLFLAPTVLRFFLSFMLRNGVFFDSEEHVANLRRAIAIAELACKELPLTAKLGQTLPSKFDMACKECWGTRGNHGVQIFANLPDIVADVTDNGSPATHSPGSFEKELLKQAIEVVPSDVVLDSITARQALEDNLDTDADVPITNIPISGDPWTAAILAEHYTSSSWTDVSLPSLMHFLGPTVLPLTFSTGIVEFSTRKVDKIVAPEEVKPTSSSLAMAMAMAVEQDLERRFFRVVMNPWVHSADEETVDFPRPVIAPGSKGVVIPEFVLDGTEIIDNDIDPFDPYHDDITILVDEETVANFAQGMGLCGTWVEMSRQCQRDGGNRNGEPGEPGDRDGDGDREGGEGGEVKRKHPRESFWYVESLVAVVPSFYEESEADSELVLEGNEGDGDADV